MSEPVDPTRPDTAGWTLPRLAIDRDGAWLHEGVEVTHAGILANVWSNLRVDADGHHLQIGPYRVPVEVADAPFAVVRVEPDGDALRVTLNDGTQERVEAGALWFRDAVPYCRVKAGAFEARLSRAAAHQLWALVEVDEGSGQARLVLGGRRHVLPIR